MTPPLLRFGVLEVNLDQAQLYREGRLIRLQHQPFEVLRALVEQPGELVSREALRGRLWPAGVTVNFDQSLNKTIAKLREALRDSADSPRFVQTVPKRGYRFIAPITGGAVESRRAVPQPPEPRRALRASREWVWLSLAAAVGLGLLALRRE